MLGTVTLGYGQGALSPPDLPETLPRGLFTVGAKDGSNLHYRVLGGRTTRGSTSTTIVAVPMRSVDQTLNRLLLVEALVIAGVLAATGRRRRLPRAARAAPARAHGRHGRRDRRRRPLPPRHRRRRHNEVGRLGVALNAMLDRLELAFRERKASEDRLRSFIADASHELRTPLQSIRGYAEIFRMGAAADPEQTATAMRRIEDEAARMGVLVEDLLTLARLDELPGRRARRRRPDHAGAPTPRPTRARPSPAGP